MRKKTVNYIGSIWILFLLAATPWKVYAADENILIEEIEEAAKEGKVYEVSQDGTKDFTSIQDGVDNIEEGDTLLIYPGVYEEKINASGKMVNLIGAFRDECVLKYAGDYYEDAPLFISAGSVRNMTIYSYKSEESDINPIDVEYSTAQTYPGYAIHIDNDYEYGKDLDISNCRIISETNFCVGMGCRGESNITFSQCQFLAKGEAGCIYLHDGISEETVGISNVSYIDCVMENQRCPYFFIIHAIRDDNRINLTFQNVKVNTVAYDKKNVYSTSNMFVGQEVVRSRNNKGITYLMVKDGENVHKSSEEGKIRVPLCIWNKSGLTGDGWCGLTNTFLTQSSFGNTLDIMNLE